MSNSEFQTEFSSNIDEKLSRNLLKSDSVIKRNARERKRILEVNKAFDLLRQRVPSTSCHRKISKVYYCYCLKKKVLYG